MDKLIKLFNVIELTRNQTQYGYALSGISKYELSDLAQHHYLVAFVAWQLVRHVNRSGADVDTAKVLEFAMIHDLGELFGGDIAMPYGKANPKARKLAKAFEEENQRYLSRFFDKDKKYFNDLANEILDAKSDEALISKLADYIEVTHYKLLVGKMTENDVVMAEKKLATIVKKIKNKIARTELEQLIADWAKGMKTIKHNQLFEENKV